VDSKPSTVINKYIHAYINKMASLGKARRDSKVKIKMCHVLEVETWKREDRQVLYLMGYKRYGKEQIKSLER
jgi:hypothetical protein